MCILVMFPVNDWRTRYDSQSRRRILQPATSGVMAPPTPSSACTEGQSLMMPSAGLRRMMKYYRSEFKKIDGDVLQLEQNL